MRIEFLCISILRVASGPRMKLATCISALPPPPTPTSPTTPAVVCSAGRSGGPGVGLAVCCFVVCSTGRFVL